MTTTIAFDDNQSFDLAQELLRRAPATLGVQVSPSNRTVTVADDRLVRLMARLNDASWAILPYFGAKADFWMLTAKTPLDLEQARIRLIRFLTPSYGRFDNEQPVVSMFDPTASDLQKLASPLFPSGYYRWQSDTQDRGIVLERLMLWLNLEAAEPRLQQEVIFTYAQLQRLFIEALVDQQWQHAEWALDELSRRNLTTAENLVFLRLQWLAAQGLWAVIWEDANFPTWAELCVPRPVRSLLLSACYTQELQSFELQGDWTEAMAAFATIRPRLGRLLSGPFQFDQPEVARLVSYQAVVDQDHQRIALLLASDLDLRSEHLLKAMLAVRPLPSPAVRTESALEKAISALAVQDFAAAEQIIPTVPDPDARVVLFLELAFHSQDELIGQRAWGAYQSLSFAEQELLPSHQRFVAEYLTNLKDRLLPATPQGSDPTQPNAQALASMAAEQPQALRTWQAISALERRLRVVVGERYQAHFGGSWEEQLHPDPAYLTRWQEMRNRDLRSFRDYEMPESPLVDYTYIEDLTGMITRQWLLFQDIFGQQRNAKSQLSDKISTVSRVRNPLAHNRDVPANELIRAANCCADLLAMLGADQHCV